MLNYLREIQALQNGEQNGGQPVNVTQLGSALARLTGNQPGAGCPNGTCGGNQDAAATEGAIANGAAAIPNLGSLLSWLTPQNGNNNNGVAPVGAASGPQNANGASGPQAAAPQGAAPMGGEGQWGPEDEQMLEKAVSATGGGGAPGAGAGTTETGANGKEMFNHLFEDFGQSQEGNCASVAVIKAALDKYKGKVFNSVSKQGDGYSVSLQDGGNVQVSKQDLSTAAKHAKLKSNKPSEAKSMAVLMYAVIGKQAAKENGGNFESALSSLGKGKDPRQVAKWLGLGNKIREVNPNDKGQEAVVAWNGNHAVYIDDGTKTDSYGQAKAADGTDTRGGRLTNAFTFA